jgi:hypothetical protein
VPDGVRSCSCRRRRAEGSVRVRGRRLGANKESWSIDAGELYGDTALEATRGRKLDELLARTFPARRREPTIAMLAVDSGYNTQVVYNWARQHPMSRVIATKGVACARCSSARRRRSTSRCAARSSARGYKVWPVGVDIAKASSTAGCGCARTTTATAPPGYCHFPEHGEDFFQQLTAEHLVTDGEQEDAAEARVAGAEPREPHLDCRISRARGGGARLDGSTPPSAEANRRPASAPTRRERGAGPPPPRRRTPAPRRARGLLEQASAAAAGAAGSGAVVDTRERVILTSGMATPIWTQADIDKLKARSRRACSRSATPARRRDDHVPVARGDALAARRDGRPGPTAHRVSAASRSARASTRRGAVKQRAEFRELRISWWDRFLIGIAPAGGSAASARARVQFARTTRPRRLRRRTDGWRAARATRTSRTGPRSALRELSRDLRRNNGWAKRGIQAIVEQHRRLGHHAEGEGAPEHTRARAKARSVERLGRHDGVRLRRR